MKNEDSQDRFPQVQAALAMAVEPIRRLVYSTPQLTLAHPFGEMSGGVTGVVRHATRRLLQTGGGIPGGITL